MTTLAQMSSYSELTFKLSRSRLSQEEEMDLLAKKFSGLHIESEMDKLASKFAALSIEDPMETLAIKFAGMEIRDPEDHMEIDPMEIDPMEIDEPQEQMKTNKNHIENIGPINVVPVYAEYICCNNCSHPVFFSNAMMVFPPRVFLSRAVAPQPPTFFLMRLMQWRSNRDDEGKNGYDEG